MCTQLSQKVAGTCTLMPRGLLRKAAPLLGALVAPCRLGHSPSTWQASHDLNLDLHQGSCAVQVMMLATQPPLLRLHMAPAASSLRPCIAKVALCNQARHAPPLEQTPISLHKHGGEGRSHPSYRIQRTAASCTLRAQSRQGLGCDRGARALAAAEGKLQVLVLLLSPLTQLLAAADAANATAADADAAKPLLLLHRGLQAGQRQTSTLVQPERKRWGR